MEDILGGCCTAYAVVSDQSKIGEIERRERTARQQIQGKGWLVKIRNKLMRSIGRDYCIELRDKINIMDHRPLLASMILLLEQTIRLDQSIG